MQVVGADLIEFPRFSVRITFMVIVKSEFTLALNQVASERGITAEEVIESMQAAILAAFRKEHPEIVMIKGEDDEEIVDPAIQVNVNKVTGETKIVKDGKDITPPGFGRIAAQTARQVIIQKIKIGRAHV